MKTMSIEEYEARKEIENRQHLAKEIAHNLAQDSSFLISLGKSIVYQMQDENFVDDIAQAIMDAPINPGGSYTASIPVKNAAGTTEEDHVS